MMRCVFILLLLTTHVIHINSQNRTIFGRVTDQISQEKLIGASIVDLNSGRGTTTDNYGLFSLIVQGDDAHLLISYVGYSNDSIFLPELTDTILVFNLMPNATIDEVVLYYKPVSRDPLKLSFDEIMQTPSLGGEADVLKAFQLMPGIQSGHEGSSTIHVRGGGPGENLILLDNVPLYYMNHLGGFVSIFNPDIINHIDLYKEGFPAKFGGRLSSVMDITMKEGSPSRHKGAASVGIISAKASMGGPIIKGKLTYLFSARRTIYDLFSRLIFPLVVEDFSMGYHFLDVNGKLTYRINEKHTVHAGMYYGNDRLIFSYNDKDFNEKAQLINKWGNRFLSFDSKSILSKNIQVFNQLVIANYRLKNEYTSSITQPEPIELYRFQLSELKDFGLRSDWTFSPFYRWTVYSGFEITQQWFVPAATSETRPVSFSEYASVKYLKYGLYLDNRIKLHDKVVLNAGLRISSNKGMVTTEVFPEPRLKLIARFGEGTTVSVSTSRMLQHIHQLESSGNIMHSEFWLPITDQTPPAEAFQYSIGLEQTVLNSSLSFEADIYYKTLQKLIEFKEGDLNLFGSNDWIRKLETGGTGKAWGVETLIRKSSGKTTGFIGYTYSRSYRQFSGINGGNPYPYAFDRPHDISISLNYSLTRKISFHAVWIYKTGLPITIPIGLHETISDNPDLGNEAYIYSKKNEFRMKDYHRLDLGLNYSKQKKRVDVIWSLSVYNVYNRQNPYYYYLDYDENLYDGVRTADEPFRMKQTAFFPLMPSINYRIEF